MRMFTIRRAMAGMALVAMAMAVSAVSAHAENLPDPTKPPASLGQGEAVASGPVLQSILIAPTRRIAVISGKTLRVGDKFDDAKVVSIGETEVVLMSGKNKQVLRLYPLMRKTASDSRPVGKPDVQQR